MEQQVRTEAERALRAAWPFVRDKLGRLGWTGQTPDVSAINFVSYRHDVVLDRTGQPHTVSTISFCVTAPMSLFTWKHNNAGTRVDANHGVIIPADSFWSYVGLDLRAIPNNPIQVHGKLARYPAWIVRVAFMHIEDADFGTETRRSGPAHSLRKSRTQEAHRSGLQAIRAAQSAL